jgi:hypothetical protein
MDEHETKPPESGSDAGKAAADVAQQAKEAGSRLFSRFTAALSGVGKAVGPTAREVGAKAADVTAVAGEKAGPIAHKVADATEDAGHKLAAKASDVAADLRRPGGADAEVPAAEAEVPAAEAPAAAAPEPATTEMPEAPAEGSTGA